MASTRPRGINAVLRAASAATPQCRRCRKAVDRVTEVPTSDGAAFSVGCHGEVETFRISSADLRGLPFSASMDAILQPFADPAGPFSTRRAAPAPQARPAGEPLDRFEQIELSIYGVRVAMERGAIRGSAYETAFERGAAEARRAAAEIQASFPTVSPEEIERVTRPSAPGAEELTTVGRRKITK